MSCSILLTSFAPWRAHQQSNSSDDLLLYLQRQQVLPANSVLLRQLPVNYELAPAIVMAKLLELHPRLVLCCGMAENRPWLTLEQTGRWQQTVRHTSLDLAQLMRDTQMTQISSYAGTYVCNYLYFRVLDVIERHRWPTQALFIHVPVLTLANRTMVMADIALILHRLASELVETRSSDGEEPWPTSTLQHK